MFPQENEYKSLLPKNAHGSPNFDKAPCTITELTSISIIYAQVPDRKCILSFINFSGFQGVLSDSKATFWKASES